MEDRLIEVKADLDKEIAERCVGNQIATRSLYSPLTDGIRSRRTFEGDGDGCEGQRKGE